MLSIKLITITGNTARHVYTCSSAA